MSLSTPSATRKFRNRIRTGYASALCRHPMPSAVASSPQPQRNALSVLPQAVWLHVLEFLDVPDIQQCRRVDKATLALLSHTTESKQALWMPACQRAWPWLDTHSDVRVQGKDLATLPLSSSTRTSTGAPSYPVLLAMAASKSNAIDDQSFTKVPGALKRLCNETVQYTGEIGVGDRCVRANVPLPRPIMLQQEERRVRRVRSRKRWNPLYRNKEASNSASSSSVNVSVAAWKPFCAPYALNQTAVDLTPRLVSYYEVSILDAPAAGPLECVAVGLCTKSFKLSNYMPGWCSASFGYHGDDGGIYHADGHMVRPYGETFGANDTIGCGIDYQQRHIFFTKNGLFLGYAMRVPDKMMVQDMFPVVGMDTNCPVACNFGTTTPFQFDLASFTLQHEYIVAKVIGRKLR